MLWNRNVIFLCFQVALVLQWWRYLTCWLRGEEYRPGQIGRPADRQTDKQTAWSPLAKLAIMLIWWWWSWFWVRETSLKLKKTALETSRDRVGGEWISWFWPLVDGMDLLHLDFDESERSKLPLEGGVSLISVRNLISFMPSQPHSWFLHFSPELVSWILSKVRIPSQETCSVETNVIFH